MSKLYLLKTIVSMLVLTLIIFSNNSYAQSHPNIEFENFWIVLPPSVARSTAGYGVIKNTGNAADRLIGIKSNAGAVMLHKTNISGGRAKMIHMENMLINANSELTLEPMSFHLMFMDLCPIIFIEGGRATITFEFENSGLIEVEVPIKPSW